MLGDYGLRALNPDLLYLARDAAYDDPATTRELRKAHQQILGNQERDLAGFRPGPDDPPLFDELMSYELLGAFQTMRVRASWALLARRRHVEQRRPVSCRARSL